MPTNREDFGGVPLLIVADKKLGVALQFSRFE